MNEEKPPPRVCPRCNSDNTKFCYYNNHSLSQPRYSCKNCRRYWTHGGALRNIPIGGSSRKKSTNSQPSASHVNSVNLQQQGNHQQPFLNIQENNGFLGSFGDSSSSVGNHYGNHYRSFPEIHGDPRRNFGPMEASNFTEGSFQQNYFDVGSNDLIGNPLINQLTGEHVYDYNGFHVNQEDLNGWNHSFNNTMNMNNIESTSGWNHSFNNIMNMDNMESTSGSRGSPVINKCILRSPYHFEKHGP